MDRFVHASAKIGKFSSGGVDVNLHGRHPSVRTASFSVPDQRATAVTFSLVSQSLPDPAAVRTLVGQRSMWNSIDVVETTGSTNADVADLARAGTAEGHVLVAGEQSAGRGRLDRSWMSPRGSSLSISMLLRPEPDFRYWGWLSLLAGMAVAAALSEIAPEPSLVQLKWPNDVLIEGGKVCGILSERVEHPGGALAVVGVGLNVDQALEDLPVPTATSLALSGFPVDRNAIVGGILRRVEAFYGEWQQAGSLMQEYRRHCASVGAELSITVSPEVEVRGRGHGVDEFGRLQVSTTTGIQTFAVGDVVHARMQP